MAESDGMLGSIRQAKTGSLAYELLQFAVRVLRIDVDARPNHRNLREAIGVLLHELGGRRRLRK